MVLIGGNLEDISQTAARIRESGRAAASSTVGAAALAGELVASVESATQQMIVRFEGIAADLDAQIQGTTSALQAADWSGRSRESANEIQISLQSQVQSILERARAELEAEKGQFVTRSQGLLAAIESDFGAVMNDVDIRFGELASAAEQTRANLEEADRTISMG